MNPLDWFEKVTDIPDAGLRMQRTASPEEREALRTALEVLSCDRVAVNYRIRLRGADCYHLDGRLEADVTQACVVSLDPVPQRIATRLDVEFQAGAVEAAAEADIDDPMAHSEVEPIENGRIDVGRVVFEEIASLIDPYPRADGVPLERHESGSTEARPDNPFAKLAALKDRKPGL